MFEAESIGWLGPLGDRGGYGNVCRNYVRGLLDIGQPLRVVSSTGVHADIGDRDGDLVERAEEAFTGDEDLLVVHADPAGIASRAAELRAQHPGVRIAGCTIAETERIPDAWASASLAVDELWVPTTFNLLTFGRSGVDPARMRLVPYGIDPHGLDPSGPVDRTVAPDDHTVFLYAFAFDWRKGFDLLLEAYLTEFTRADRTTLVLKVYDDSDRPGTVKGRVAASVADRVDLFGMDLPRVVVLDDALPREDLMALYRRADLYVSTDRANGWGMPVMEAMTLGKAAACIDWSGSTEFVRADNGLPIPAQPRLEPVDARLQAERPEYRGQHWPEVRVEDVRAVLRLAHAGEVDLAGLGQAARAEMLEAWTVQDAARWVRDRDTAPYRSRPGLAAHLRPLVGLMPDGLGEVGASVIACEVGPDAPWQAALDAYATAFAPGDPVTLCLFAGLGIDPQDVAIGAAEVLGDRLDRIADVVVAGVPDEEVLVDPRVAAVVAPNALWPYAARTVAPDAGALAAAVRDHAPLPVEL